MLARNENVMGSREVPIHLELNSVASRASRAAIHPAAGSCRSPGDAAGDPEPAATLGSAVMLGKGEETQAWRQRERLGSVQPLGFALRVVSAVCRGIFGRSWCAWQCVARRWCWDPVPLALTGRRTGRRSAGSLCFPGSLRLRGEALRGEGGGDAGSWLARSRWKIRDPQIRLGRTLSQEQHTGEVVEKDDHDLCLKSTLLGRFPVPQCSDIA